MLYRATLIFNNGYSLELADPYSSKDEALNDIGGKLENIFINVVRVNIYPEDGQKPLLQKKVMKASFANYQI